jgi:hypothetical protein
VRRDKLQRKSAPHARPEGISGELLKSKIGALERSRLDPVWYVRGVDENDSVELVAALRSQVDANNERLRRTREIVEVISQHLDSSPLPRKRRKKK